MKKIFTKLMLLAVAAAALVSCENNYEEQAPVAELTQTVTLSTEKPTEVRTQLIEGVPYWSADDAVGVYLEDHTKHYKFDNTAEEASLTATFKGETAVANTLYVYYPYTSNGTADKGAKVDIPVIQHPTLTSFDGAADIMLAKPVTLDEEGKQVSDLEFARLGAILKIALNDETSKLAGQHLSSLTVTAESNLVGRVYIDVKNQELGELYYGGSKSVTAEYEPEQFEINADNVIYLVVYPQTLAAGSKLTFTASTEGYAISKVAALDNGDMLLESGVIRPIMLTLRDEDVTKEDTGLALPFKDDFARVAYDASEGGIDLSVLGENYSAMEKVYKAKIGEGGILKLGTGSAEGYFTTTALDLSKPFTVFVEAQRYGTSTSDKLQITVGSQVKTSTNLTADSKYYVFEFEAASKKEQVEIRTVKRAYINDLQIVEGHGLDVPTLPAVLTVTKSEISVSHEAATETFTYSVANPVEGTSVVITDDAEWLTTADNNGTVTVTVEENTLEEVRNATITVKYGDLTKTVTVKQDAKPAEGGDEGGVVVDVLNRELTGVTKNNTSYSDWSDKTSNSTAVYAGNSAGGNDAIQLRSAADKAASGVITTTSGGVARKVVITWESNTSNGRTLNIYGKNTAYSSVGDLRDTNKCGTKLGTIVKGTSTELTITGNYQYIGLCSNSGAMYITKIEITWESGEGGGSTPEPEPATPVLSVNPTTLSFDAAAGSKTIACTIENEVSGQNVTATSSDTSWLTTSVSGKTVTVTATENTTTSERTATVTISYQGAESKTVTVSQAAGESTGGDEGGETQPVTVTKTSFSEVSGSLDSVISYTTAKNDGTTAPVINSSAIRLYQPSSGKTNGGSITITAKEGYTITSITIGSNQKTTTAYSIDGGATSSNSDIAANGKLTVTKDAQSITFYCRGASSNNRLNVNYISVTYK